MDSLESIRDLVAVVPIFYQLYARPSGHSVVSLVHLDSQGGINLQSGLDPLLLGLGAGRKHLVEIYMVSKLSN